MKRNLSVWLSQIEDNNLHHIGEFYTYCTGRPWHRKFGGCAGNYTVGFQRWLMDKDNLTEKDIEKIGEGFWIMRDMGPAFLIRRRI
jgi:hypothetical protein